MGLSDASEKIGFRSLGVKLTVEKIVEAPLPCILHWNQDHFVVLFKIKKLKDSYQFSISDPAYGLITLEEKDFLISWIGNNATKKTKAGIALLLEVSPRFYEIEHAEELNGLDLTFLLKYFVQYKSFLWQLVFGLIAASLLQVLFPFLTQSVVDIGIRNRDIHFVYLVLFAQIALFIGKTAIEIIRSWILLHLSTRINISLISDFFIKLMSLPIAFFDTRMTGDILQRINDHKRIESILTTSSLSVLFSMVNLLVFSVVLAYYSIHLFSIFVIGSLMYFIWILVFLKKRKELDYKRFSQISQEQSKVIELINGMQEIKLHNAEKQKRWSWEFVQARLFKISIEALSLEQYQSVGSDFINQGKNILITVLSAKLVIDGSITLGMMLAISYIVGQLNGPISQLIGFVQELQDAKISLDRLSEIHDKEGEIPKNKTLINQLNDFEDLIVSKLSFRYIGYDKLILKKINVTIPKNKITAIVGTSGSGKTTLMKLLLGFYKPNKGKISVGSNDLQDINPKEWRSKCGVVMQEGYIFNDSIANNIAIGEDFVDKAKLLHAVKVANIGDFINELPQSFNTKIGMEGIGLSSGQKQRILIARSVYKNPMYLFFDEATSALDANNEKVIMENLNEFFKNRTVVIVAHRLSTVKNADQIIVVEKGKIVEIGNHNTLVKERGYYYSLVRNQLELGK
tara:strand:- start:21302 stop:23356 length:2055 start_codon:yes stop_codon:yes gene_type:complete